MRGSSRWTLAVGAAGVGVLLSGCVQGPPEASGTLPPLSSASPDVSAETPTSTPSAAAPSPSPEEEATPPSDPATPSAAATPTPTATPTAPVPEGLTPIQLEAAAFVEQFWESFARSVDEGDTSISASLMTDGCGCQASVDVVDELLTDGGVRQGGEIRVDRVLQVFADASASQAQVIYEVTEEKGRIDFPDNTYSNIPEQSGPRLINLERTDDSFLVQGVLNLDEEPPE